MAAAQMSTARWQLKNADVPVARVNVYRPFGGGCLVQLGELELWVESQKHWADICERVMACFESLPAPRQIPLPRTDSLNLAGSCYSGDDE